MEIWKDIPGFENHYQASNLGNIRSLKTMFPRILKQHENEDGYLIVSLYVYGYRRTKKVHRLIAETFIENPENKPEINHLDEVKSNNFVENLEWSTRFENNNHGLRNEKSRNSLLNGSLSKKVYQYDMDLNLIKVWESSSEAGRNGFNFSNICSCCRGERKTHKNFIWSWVKLKK